MLYYLIFLPIVQAAPKNRNPNSRSCIHPAYSLLALSSLQVPRFDLWKPLKNSVDDKLYINLSDNALVDDQFFDRVTTFLNGSHLDYFSASGDNALKLDNHSRRELSFKFPFNKENTYSAPVSSSDFPGIHNRTHDMMVRSFAAGQVVFGDSSLMIPSLENPELLFFFQKDSPAIQIGYDYRDKSFNHAVRVRLPKFSFDTSSGCKDWIDENLDMRFPTMAKLKATSGDFLEDSRTILGEKGIMSISMFRMTSPLAGQKSSLPKQAEGTGQIKGSLMNPTVPMQSKTAPPPKGSPAASKIASVTLQTGPVTPTKGNPEDSSKESTVTLISSENPKFDITTPAPNTAASTKPTRITDLVFDGPFYFGVIHKSDGLPLLWGKIVDPSRSH